MTGAGAGDALERASEPKPAKPKRAVLATVPSDSHMWNLVFLELLLKERGIEVTNLGACTPIELVVDTCLAERPDLLVISSVNGHGHLGGRRLINAIRERPEFAEPLVEAGYSAVFIEADGVAPFKEYLEAPRELVA
jgi:methylaspartate mutase sigma subunit